MASKYAWSPSPFALMQGYDQTLRAQGREPLLEYRMRAQTAINKMLFVKEATHEQPSH